MAIGKNTDAGVRKMSNSNGNTWESLFRSAAVGGPMKLKAENIREEQEPVCDMEPVCNCHPMACEGGVVHHQDCDCSK